MVQTPVDRSRVDYWLWCVRAYKTRTLAKQACLAGHVSVDSKKAKPATGISVGATITLTTPRGQKTLHVLALPPTRVSAADSGAFAQDLTPPEPVQGKGNFLVTGVSRERGLGRPTKKDRRAIERWEGGAP
jgi:ribosome-associated heat shock protein Hsp15